jgi:hypothetical protein
MPPVRTATVPWPAVKPEVLYSFAPGLYRLADHRLAILDPATNQALVIEVEPVPQKEKRK